MNHKTIEEYFCERKLKLGTPVFIDGCEYTVVLLRPGRVGLLDMRSYVVVSECPTTISTPSGYVRDIEMYALVDTGDIVHIGLDEDTNVTVKEYFGERKIPIGPLVILDGVEHRLTRSGRGNSCSLISTDTWVESRIMTNVPGTYTDGLTRQQLHLLSMPYASIVIGDTDE